MLSNLRSRIWRLSPDQVLQVYAITHLPNPSPDPHHLWSEAIDHNYTHADLVIPFLERTDHQSRQIVAILLNMPAPVLPDPALNSTIIQALLTEP